MQNRHLDRRSYFNELATTSEAYYIPYLERHIGKIVPGMKVLEIGCGEGGNLEPFAERGCEVTGVDIVKERTEQAKTFFAQDGVEGTFICNDASKCEGFDGKFDIVLAHDVIEHVHDKLGFLSAALRFLRPGGYAFFGFPAWYMPFGGHQQICRSKFCSHAPFLHLLPMPLYRMTLENCNVKEKDVLELMDIRETRTTIELFEKTARKAGFSLANRHFWFINPHYKAKFGLTPRTLCKAIAAIPYVRDFFTTSAFFLLQKPNTEQNPKQQ